MRFEQELHHERAIFGQSLQIFEMQRSPRHTVYMGFLYRPSKVNVHSVTQSGHINVAKRTEPMDSTKNQKYKMSREVKKYHNVL